MGQTSRGRVYLVCELVGVFVLLPGALAVQRAMEWPVGFRPPVIPMIWVIAGSCLWWLMGRGDFDRRCLWLGPKHNFRKYLPGVLVRFAVLGSLLTAVVYQYAPDIFLSFPRERPGLWLIVMFAYPVLSVYPQGIVWRGFICHRYRALFGSGIVMLIAASVLFSIGHILLLNGVALAITFVGGLLFTRTYQRTGSLLLASIEHALYGDLAFTLGLGYYLYAGRVGG